jgi:hypothetical protein
VIAVSAKTVIWVLGLTAARPETSDFGLTTVRAEEKCVYLLSVFEVVLGVCSIEL